MVFGPSVEREKVGRAGWGGRSMTKSKQRVGPSERKGRRRNRVPGSQTDLVSKSTIRTPETVGQTKRV